MKYDKLPLTKTKSLQKSSIDVWLSICDALNEPVAK